MKTCLRTIKNKYQNLTTTEKRIADYILKHGEKVISMSTDELAQSANAAKSAVIRCCKSLGFDGYSEFKISLSAELAKNRQLNFVPYIYPDDNTGEILDKVFSATVKTLHETAEKIDRQILDSVIDLIEQSEKIYIYGVGTSAIIVNEFQYRLILLGYNAICFTDAASMKISTMNLSGKDTAIGISHSGRTAATIESLSIARQKGAKTVCITSYPKSRITQESDFPLEVCTDEIQYPIEATSSRIAHISLIDTIIIALSAKNYDDAAQRAKRSHELVETIRYK